MKRRKPGHTALHIVQKYHPGVIAVSDAKGAAKFVVTEEDCAQGKKKEPGACALARAALRQYDGAVISMHSAYLIKGNKAVRFRVPQSVAREIVSFDRSQAFAPGEYELKTFPKSARLGTRLYGQKPRKNHGSAKYRNDRSRAHKTQGIRAL